MNLVKVKIVAFGDTDGARYADVFQAPDGTTKEIESTMEAYKALGQLNPKNPTLEGHRWVQSYSDHRYNTATGRLEDGMYSEEGANDHYIVKLNGTQFTVDKKLIVKDILDDTEVVAPLGIK